MRSKLRDNQKFSLSFEVGQYYMGYENPSKVTDYSQKTVKNEWTIFVRAKDPQFRPLISQFINFVDFQIPKSTKLISVDAPEEHFNNVQDSKANY